MAAKFLQKWEVRSLSFHQLLVVRLNKKLGGQHKSGLRACEGPGCIFNSSAKEYNKVSMSLVSFEAPAQMLLV
jgi:hypothetical protein